MLQLAAGAAVGIPVAWLAFGVFGDSSLAGDVERFAGAFAAGLLIMVGLGLAACTAPTLRALRITPSEAFKGDGWG